MKKILILITGILTVFTYKLNAQSTAFDKFEDYDEVTTVVVTKKAFTMLRKIAEENEDAQEFNELVNGLEVLKVFSTDDTKTAVEMRNAFNKYLKNNSLEELMHVKDEGKLVKIFVKEGKDEDHVSEFLMMVDGLNDNTKNGEPEFVIISILGDISLNNISKITSQMNIPEGDQIKKVEKKH